MTSLNGYDRIGVERNWLQISAPLPLKNSLKLKPLSSGSIAVDSNFKLAISVLRYSFRSNAKKGEKKIAQVYVAYR